MYISEIWRYPVKSMAGEQLQSATLTPAGIEGDRIVQVQDKRGRTMTARTYPDLLGLHAMLGSDGQLLIDGRAWTDPQVLAAVRMIANPDAHLVRDESLDRFDVLPLLVATDGAIAEFGRDGRRLRPNIVIGGVAGLTEREWEGGQLFVEGGVVIGVQDLRARCNMTMTDPDTLAYDPGVLRDIVKRFGGKLALNCDVVKGGEIRVEQEVRFVPHSAA